MSRKELGRLRVIGAVSEKHLTQRAAALRLGLCVRQVRNLVRRYREQGEAGLISGHCGQSPGNWLPEAVREEALAEVRNTRSDSSANVNP